MPPTDAANCSVATQLSQFYKHSESANLQLLFTAILNPFASKSLLLRDLAVPIDTKSNVNIRFVPICPLAHIMPLFHKFVTKNIISQYVIIPFLCLFQRFRPTSWPTQGCKHRNFFSPVSQLATGLECKKSPSMPRRISKTGHGHQKCRFLPRFSTQGGAHTQEISFHAPANFKSGAYAQDMSIFAPLLTP